MSNDTGYLVLATCAVCEEEDSDERLVRWDEDGAMVHPKCEDWAREGAEEARAEARRDWLEGRL